MPLGVAVARMNARRLVGRNLRKLRVAKGLSQEALATDAEVDRAYVGKLERGEENPTIALLERLAGALSVRIGLLFQEFAPGEPPPAPLRGGRRPTRKTGRPSLRR